MYSLTFLGALSAATLIIGLILGLLLGRRMSPGGQKYRETELKLDQVLQDKKAYEDDVVAHFSDTAQLLNQLTDSYKNVHNHLASGAANLCQGQGPVSLERGDNRPDASEIPAHLADIQAPLDYAPKTSPEQPGMLNETFGLERNLSEESLPEEEPVTPASAR